MRASRLSLRLFAGLAAILAAGLVWVSAVDESIGPTAPVGSSIVVLEPGENLVGWVGHSRSIAQLRAQAPDIESIQEWDADSQQLIDAGSVDAGQGYVVTLGGEASVFLWRPMTSVKGKVELKRGRNLVTWLGPDDWSIDRAVLGIGRALVRVDWKGTTYRPSQSRDIDSLPLVQRGDALWVEVSRVLNWLQPAGVLPTVKFAGNIDETLQSAVRRDSEDAMGYYADEFGLQPDGSVLTVYVAASLEALIAAFAADGVQDDAARRLWQAARGWSNPQGHIVLKLELWGPETYENQRGAYGDYQLGRYALVHEYYHVIQQQASGTNAALWLVEGGAEWAKTDMRRIDAETSLDEELADNRNLAGAQDAPSLVQTERGLARWHYTLGALASHQLALRNGKYSLVEFWRALLPQPLGPFGRWQSSPPWRSVFQDVFGLSVDEFYAEFAFWRSDFIRPTVRGRVLGPDGQGLPYVRVVGRLSRLQDSDHDYVDTYTDQDGMFTLSVSESGFAQVGVELGGCEIYYTSDVLVSDWSQAEQVNALEERSQRLLLSVSDGICVWQIRGQLTDAHGDGIADQSIFMQSDNGSGLHVQTAADGTFSTTVPIAGRYTLEANIGGCPVYYRRGGATASHAEATGITIDGQDVSDVRFQLRADQCSIEITGRLLDADGNPLPGFHIWAESDNGTGSSPGSISDGSFAIVVPSAGQYHIIAEIDGCLIYYRQSGAVGGLEEATRVQVTESAGAEIDFRLSEGLCAFRISGQLLGADGAPKSNQRVGVRGGTDDSEVWTDFNGRFVIAVPAVGSYRLYAVFDDCTIYRGSDGPVRDWDGARVVRVSDADVTDVEFRLPEDPSSFCG